MNRPYINSNAAAQALLASGRLKSYAAALRDRRGAACSAAKAISQPVQSELPHIVKMARGNRPLSMLTVLVLAATLLAFLCAALVDATERTSGVQYKAAQSW
jgi:hypothetical protein